MRRARVLVPVRPRRLAIGLPAAAAGAVAAVGIQAWVAGHRRLPSFHGCDPSAVVGATGLPPVRLVLLGDSSMTGPGLEHAEEIWVRQVVARLATRYEVDVRSVAVGGSRTRDVLETQTDAALAHDADVAIVSVGANDALRGTPMPRVERMLDDAVGRLARHHAVVVLCGVADVGDAPRMPFPIGAIASDRSRAADAVHGRVAANHERVVKIPLRRVLGTRFRDPGLFAPDLFHPNAAGHAIWAQAAFPVVATATAIGARARVTGGAEVPSPT